MSIQSVNAVLHFFLPSPRLTVLHSTKSSITTIEAERRCLREYLAVSDRMANKMQGKQES
jgi:hypothetical protein